MNSTSPEVFYSTKEAAKIAGATMRQLQWWDERHVVQPRQQGHSRIYTKLDVVTLCAVSDMRAKDIPLQRIRKVLPLIIKAVSNGFDFFYLVVSRYRNFTTSDRYAVVAECLAAKTAVYVIEIRGVIPPGSKRVTIKPEPKPKRTYAARVGFVPKRIDYKGAGQTRKVMLSRATSEETFLLGPPREY